MSDLFDILSKQIIDGCIDAIGGLSVTEYEQQRRI